MSDPRPQGVENPTHANHKIKRTTLKVVLFLEREKGLMAAPETLLAPPSGYSLALKVLNSSHGLRPRKNLVGPSSRVLVQITI